LILQLIIDVIVSDITFIDINDNILKNQYHFIRSNIRSNISSNVFNYFKINKLN